MGLDGYVRCRCIQDGLAKPHPIPHMLALDETTEPYLAGDPSPEQWALHDRWFADSCEHGGYILSERLGNISLIAHIRELVRHLRGNPGPRFPILLDKVVYDGTHSGDRLSRVEAQELLEEIKVVLHSSDILAVSERDFFESIRRLCEASTNTGNPIMF